MRTFEKHSLESVRAEVFVYHYVIFLLPLEIIEGEGFIYDGVQLVCGHLLDLVGREKIGHVSRNIDLSVTKHIIKRLTRECAARDYGHDGHFKELEQSSQGVGQSRSRAVKGISRLGVHNHRGLKLFERVGHILDKREVGNELLRGDTAYLPHQPSLSGESVRGADGGKWAGVKIIRRYLQIYKAGVIHKHEAGLILAELLHSVLVVAHIVALEVKVRERFGQQPEKRVYLLRLFSLGAWERRNLGVGLVHYLYFHIFVLQCKRFESYTDFILS